MRETVSVLGVLVDRGDMASATEKALEFTKSGGAVFTPNPEIIMAAHYDEEYKNILNSADMVIPDGIGVVIASKILKKPVKERVAGFDLTCNILRLAAKENIPVYIFGGKPGVAEAAAEKIKEDYGAPVCGFQHGYHKDDTPVIEDIKEKKPGILLVCLGAPKQEKWIIENKDKFSPCLMIGAGGSVDVLSGKTKRAPEIFIKLNLEWFYRLLCQPTRFVRMLQLPKFIITVFFKGNRQGGKND